MKDILDESIQAYQRRYKKLLWGLLPAFLLYAALHFLIWSKGYSVWLNHALATTMICYLEITISFYMRSGELHAMKQDLNITVKANMLVERFTCGEYAPERYINKIMIISIISTCATGIIAYFIIATYTA